MRCRAAKSRIAAYLYGDLPAKEREAFEAHAAQCAKCRGELEMTRRALGLMPAEPAPPVPEAQREEMLRSVRRAIRTAAAAQERTRRWVWSWAAAALVAGALGVGVWYTQVKGPAPAPQIAQDLPGPGLPGPDDGSSLTGIEDPGGSGEGLPRVLAVADVEIEFVTYARAEPTVAPVPAGANDVRTTR